MQKMIDFFNTNPMFSRAYWLVTIAMVVPLVVMIFLHYAGIFYPTWFSLVIIVFAYLRVKTVNYVIKIGESVDYETQARQDRPWRLIFPIFLGVGFWYYFELLKDVNLRTTFSYTVYHIPFAVLCFAGLLEFRRRFRF